MAKYAISQEGAAQMTSLAKNLQVNANSIVEASQTLANVTVSLGDGLGIYADEINALIQKNQSILRNNQEDIVKLSDRVRQKADDILSLLDLGLGVSSGLSSSKTLNGNASGSVGPSLATDRSTPRDLPVSQFGYVQDGDGNLVYDSPNETNGILYTTQGSANDDYQGTCGLCSCANILRLSGVNLSEADMIEYASNTDSATLGKLCATGYSDPGMNGGTGPKDRQQILSHFGIDSGVFQLSRSADGKIDNTNLVQIADSVSSGRGVILSVHADMLWDDAPFGIDDYHAVTVTSVKKDSAGNILGFYICDSAQGGTTYYTAEKIRQCLTGVPMNVTYQIIR